MRAEVDSHDILRILAMLPVAPNQMDAQDFLAFVNLAGAASNAEKGKSAVITMMRVSSPQSIFHGTTEFPAGVGKVQTIKEIRAATGLGLKEAKDMSDGLWVAVNITMEQFDNLQKATPKVQYEVK